MSKKIIKAQAYSEVLPNFRGHFLDLTPSRSLELDKFTTRGKTEILEASLIRAEGLLTLEEMAARIGVHKYYLSRMMNKAGLKPTRIIKQVRYYNESQYESAVRIHEKK